MRQIEPPLLRHQRIWAANRATMLNGPEGVTPVSTGQTGDAVIAALDTSL